MSYHDSVPTSPSTGVVLSSAHIANAMLKEDAPFSLDFMRLGLSEIPDNAIEQLVQLSKVHDDDTDTTIHRIALKKNHLTSLPSSFNMLWQLRYLNLRQNAFRRFPEVLCDMQSLEILDVSNNKIKAFPERPGTLVNLKVLHLGENRITALPSYFPGFRALELLIIDQNPIEWPPPHVLSANANSTDAQVAARWVSRIQGWIRDHLARHERSSIDDSSSDWRPETDSRYSLHDRTPSNESVGSHLSHSSVPDSPREHRPVNRLLLPDMVDGYSSSDRSGSMDGHGVLTPQHGRNASFTNSRRPAVNGLPLNPKKSLPELRSMQLRPSERRARTRPPLPTEVPQQHRPSISKGSSSDTSHTVRRLPPRQTFKDDTEAELKQLPPMDGERNSYFRRMSTLPASTISKAVPECLLVTVDAARGILFALTQIYSALRDYIVFSINDRLSNVLNQVLDPAYQYLARLITALDRFDALCRSGTPPPAACRGVLENCLDNITVFKKVVGLLQFQLRLLARSDDVRYTRSLVLKLYGSMAELSNSWNAMSPHIEEVQKLVSDAPELNLSGPLPLNLSRGPLSSQVIAENGELSTVGTPIASPSIGRGTPTSGRPRPPPSSERRRQGGSFSAQDLVKGREMPIVQPASVQPLVIKAPSAASKALRSHLRQTPGISSPRSTQSHGVSLHSPSLSSSSHGHGNSAGNARESDVGQSSGGSSIGHSTLSSDKDKFVDASTLSAMEQSTELALSVWTQIERLLDAAGEGPVIGRGYLNRARELTLSLQATIRAILEGASGETYGHTLWEEANTFSKDVINVLIFVKKTSTERRIPLDATLRADLQQLSKSTQEFATFLQFSSFASGKPPPSPAPSPFSGSSQYDDRAPTPSSANGISGSSESLMSPPNTIWRSRSANVMTSPPPQTPILARGSGTVGGGTPHQPAAQNSGREPQQWSGPAHPSLHSFRMPASPVLGGRIRPNGGVVGYKGSD